MKIAGTLATHDTKPFTGIITVSDKTGLITQVTKTSQKNKLKEADYFFDNNNYIFAGFGDVHIHAREDGTKKQNYKEEYKTAGDAALQGGVVHCCAMPNTPKPVTTAEDIAWHRKKVCTNNHHVSIFNYIGIDKNTKPLGKPGEHFYKLYFGKSVGDLTVLYASELDTILARYKNHCISFHVEYEPIVQAHSAGKTHTHRRPIACVHEGLRLLLPLIQKYNIQAKLCHWSTGGESFDLITEYRKKGCAITLEVSPLHLLFDEDQTKEDPSLWLKIQMNPAVQASEHRLALIRALKSGFIQYLATDHAPHTRDEKYSAFEQFREKYPQKTLQEIAQHIEGTNKELFNNTCVQNNTSGAPWLDVYSLVCGYLMRKHAFSAQDIARVASYFPGTFVNSHLKRQFPKKNFGKGFGQIKKGFVGSLTVLNIQKNTTVTKDTLKTKVQWSPLEGRTMPSAVEAVFIFGTKVR